MKHFGPPLRYLLSQRKHFLQRSGALGVMAASLFINVTGSWGQTPVAPGYTAIDLGTLGGVYASAFGINNLGQVVGISTIAGEEEYHAALYSEMGNTDLGTLGGKYGEARAINDAGQIVGYATLDGDSILHAALFSGTGNADLGTLGGTNGFGYGINNAGQIVGKGDVVGGQTHAAFFSGTGNTDMGTLGGTTSTAYAISDTGRIVGSASLTGNSPVHATLFSGTGNTDMGTLGGQESEAFAINNADQVVGSAQTVGGQTHATLFSGTGNTDLGTLGGLSSSATSINNAGQIVGNSGNAGFLYSGGTMSDLNDLAAPGSGIANINVFGYAAINDWGQIAAEGQVGGENHAVLLNPDNPLTSTSVGGTIRNTKFVSGMDYGKFTATTNPDGGGTTVALLDGTAGNAGWVGNDEGGYGLNRDVTVSFTGADNTGLASDIVELTGTFGDGIVLQLTYDQAVFGDAVALGWLDGGTWKLATDGNTGAGTLAAFYEMSYEDFLTANGGSFDLATMLGAYGTDATGLTAWAVINHNSDFAVVSAVPEPSTVVLMVLGGAVWLVWRRQRVAA